MIARGLLAGAAGTLALDLSTYVDLLASGRPASTLPATVVQRLATAAHVSALSEDAEPAGNRRQAAGALLGYGVGLGSGVAYAALRPAFRGWLPWPIAGVVLGASTLLVSEGSAVRLGATDWSTWSARDWAADVIPRSIFGLVTAYVVERLSNGESGGLSGAVPDAFGDTPAFAPNAPIFANDSDLVADGVLPDENSTGASAAEEASTAGLVPEAADADPDFSVAIEATPAASVDADFTIPVVPGRDRDMPPIDAVAIEADREVNPRIT